MGLPVVLNEKIFPALACVEAALVHECSEHPYQPKSVGGIRLDNTFKDYEVSNHVYGIALDIDPISIRVATAWESGKSAKPARRP